MSSRTTRSSKRLAEGNGGIDICHDERKSVGEIVIYDAPSRSLRSDAKASLLSSSLPCSTASGSKYSSENSSIRSSRSAARRSIRVKELSEEKPSTEGKERNEKDLEEEEGGVDVEVEEETQSQGSISVEENVDFMKSSMYPKISSRVGAKFQATIPEFFDSKKHVNNDNNNNYSNKASTKSGIDKDTLFTCVWSPRVFNVSKSKQAICVSENEVNCENQVLERYLANAKLLLSKFYQNHLVKKKRSFQTEECEDFNGDACEEDTFDKSDKIDNEVAIESPRSNKRSRQRAAKLKSNGRRSPRPCEVDYKVNTSEPIVDSSFFMISSCLEDFLLELLHKSDYHPAKALHILALTTSQIDQLPEFVKVEKETSSCGMISDNRQKKRKLEKRDGTKKQESRSVQKKSKSEDKAKHRLLSSIDDQISVKQELEDNPKKNDILSDATMLWIHDVIAATFSVISRDEQVLMSNAHGKSAFNLSKILKSVPECRKQVAISYAFRFLFAASELLLLELPNKDEMTSNASDSPSQSPRNGNYNDSVSDTQGSQTDIVTRASMRIEKRQRNRNGNDIYYFPSPRDKGPYPFEEAPSKEKRRSRKKRSDLEVVERRSYKILARMRKILDILSFRQLMNSFALYGEGALSPIDMAVRLRYIFETFLQMNFPLMPKVETRISNLCIRGEEFSEDSSDENEEDVVGEYVHSKKNNKDENMSSSKYVLLTKKLHNDFLVNFFPEQISYWREML